MHEKQHKRSAMELLENDIAAGHCVHQNFMDKLQMIYKERFLNLW